MFLQQLRMQASSGQSHLPLSTDSDQEKLVDLYCHVPDDQRQRRLVDTACAAAKYGVAQRTVQHWVSNGLIAAVLVGKKYKVDLQSVELFIRQGGQKREVI